MIITFGAYKTRSGLRAVIQAITDAHVAGIIEGSSYGRCKGTDQGTRWALDGTHELARCDDLVCTWEEYQARLLKYRWKPTA